VFDIAQHYRPGDTHDMLVRNTRLGGALAAHFASEADPSKPIHSVALMRGHGLTVHGPSIQDAVLRAVYTQQNAAIQTTALITRAAHYGLQSWSGGMSASGGEEIAYLSEKEADDAAGMTQWSAMRPWKLWLREVEAAGLYVNMAGVSL